jgi:RNA polymerase sigma-70 factor (ECF subfamily)
VEGRPPDERALVLRAQQGDEHAFAELIRAHEQIVFRIAYLITGNAADAEDAAQEGVVKAWRALARFRSEEPLRPWLIRIVANEARNRRRSAGRRLQLALRAGREEVSGDAAPSPETDVVRTDEFRRLLDTMNTLPLDARQVLSCRFLLELSEAETSAVLDLRPGTVKSRTARALERLKEAYD